MRESARLLASFAVFVAVACARQAEAPPDATTADAPDVALPDDQGTSPDALETPDTSPPDAGMDAAVMDSPAPDGPAPDTPLPSGRLGATRRDGESVTLRTHPTVNYRGVDAAYDPLRRRFLVVYGNAPIGGAVLDDDGRQEGDGFRLTDEPYAEGRWTQLPRVAYGGGGFLVTWHAQVGRGVVAQARRVALTPEGVAFAGPAAALGGEGAQQESPAAVAFSSATGEFLVVWAQSGLKARRVASTGAPLGDVVALSEEGRFVEQPSVAYHPGARCFFVTFMQVGGEAGHVVLQRVEDGTARPLGAQRDLTGPLAFAKVTDTELDAHAGEVIATWFQVRGAERGFAAQRFRGDGEPAGAARAVFPPHGSYDGYDLAWSAATGTAFAAFHGPSTDAFGAELARDLTSSTPSEATAAGARSGFFLPRVVAHPARPWWLVIGSADYARVVAQRVAREP